MQIIARIRRNVQFLRHVDNLLKNQFFSLVGNVVQKLLVRTLYRALFFPFFSQLCIHSSKIRRLRKCPVERFKIHQIFGIRKPIHSYSFYLVFHYWLLSFFLPKVNVDLNQSILYKKKRFLKWNIFISITLNINLLFLRRALHQKAGNQPKNEIWHWLQ